MNVENYLLNLQKKICNALAEIDGKENFQIDIWEKPEGGGGRTCVMQGGNVFEKAGVNFSSVYGEQLPSAATARHPMLSGSKFSAMGLSIVVHPLNPYVPTTHFNVRFINAYKPDGELFWWFGGGFDLTPYYGFIEDCAHWHRVAKNACMPFGSDKYDKYKKWCDNYFYLPHRSEPRGIGGLFFDDLNEENFETSFAFMKSVGDHFLEAYLPIVNRRKSLAFGQREKDFQYYRRGRYAEFNLLYDRGTLFGLQSKGRTESILMSLPPHATWIYQWQTEPGSPEAQLTDFFLVPRDWINTKV